MTNAVIIYKTSSVDQSDKRDTLINLSLAYYLLLIRYCACRPNTTNLIKDAINFSFFYFLRMNRVIIDPKGYHN